jgi:hypothetical protein
MHEFTPEVEALAKEVLAYSLERLKSDPPLDGPRTAEDLFNEVGNTITAKGLGGAKALEVFTEVLAKACISTDHPRNLAFIPSAPSEFANLFDLVVGASALYGGSWQEGAGAVFAENQALRWLSDLAGLPETAGGVFVQGGTIGNLSALVVARADGYDENAYNLSVGTRKIKAIWSDDKISDLQRYGVMDAEAELIKMLSDEIAKEIDAEILKDLRGQIKKKDEFVELLECVGLEITPMVYNPMNFSPQQGFITTSYERRENARKNNVIWNYWVRARGLHT